MKNTETYIGTINVKSAIKTFDEISQVFYQRKTNRYGKPVGSFSSHKQYFLEIETLLLDNGYLEKTYVR